MSAQPRPEPERPPDAEPLVDRPEVRPTPVEPGAAARDAHHRARLRERLIAGGIIGAAAGFAIASVISVLAGASEQIVWVAALVGAVAVGGLGLFWGGMATMDSPHAGEEPGSGADPVARRQMVGYENDAPRQMPGGPSSPLV